MTYKTEDAYGRQVKVMMGRDCAGALEDKYGRPLIVPVLEPDLANDHTWSGNSFEGTAGETLAQFNLVYLKSDGKYWKADADAAGTMPGVAMASDVIVADAVGVFIAPVSYVRDDTWAWTIGAVLYASGTAGGLTETAGTIPEIVGYAVTADVIFFYPLLGTATKAYADATFLKLAGGTMSGNIAMAGAQTVDGVDISVHAIDYGLHTKIVRKTADETVNNSETLQNDDELLMAMGANEVWRVELHLIIYGTTVANYKMAWTVPSGAEFYWGRIYRTTGAADVVGMTHIAAETVTMRGEGAYSRMITVAHGIYVGAATAGNLQLQWAQNTAEVSDSKVKANSCIIATKIA